MKSGSRAKEAKSRVRLSTVRDVRVLLARVVNEHRAGKLSDNAAKTQGYLLRTLAQVIVEGDTEDRLAALERQLAKITGEGDHEHIETD